ncbi:hypothetical protein RUND412_000992 [Rhizina undulata]
MDILGKHRINFNNLSIELFKNLERELEPALKGVDDEKKKLDWLLEEERSKVEELKAADVKQKAIIEEQAKKLEEFEAKLTTTVEEKSRMEEKYTQLEKVSTHRHQRTLSITQENPLENDKNIPDLFAPEIPYPRLHAPDRSLSAPKSPRRTGQNTTNDSSVQTEDPLFLNWGIQTDGLFAETTSTTAYHELARRYENVQRDLIKYKTAHEILTEKYRKSRAVWKQWIENDNARRIKIKKRPRESSADAIMERGKPRYSTPATSITADSPPLRPPALSPDRPPFNLVMNMPPSKMGGLFAGLKSYTAGDANNKANNSDVLGFDIKVATKGKDDMPGGNASNLGSQKSSEGEWPSSIPETQSQTQISAVKHFENGRKEVKPYSIKRQGRGNETTDDENEMYSEAFVSTGTTIDADEEPNSPVLPPLPPSTVKTTPLTKKRSGESEGTPVIIKSEPTSSMSDFVGYHGFELESLDLDDIGEKPDTPRKRRKIPQPKQEDSMREPELYGSMRPGWINGGFAITSVEGAEDTQDENIALAERMETDEQLSAGALPGPVLNQRNPTTGTRTDSALARPKTPESAVKKSVIRQEMPSSPPPFFPTTTPSPPRTSAIKPLLNTSIEKPLPPSRTGERRLEDHRRAAVGALEDGTDGVNSLPYDTQEYPHPPMVLVEKQRKALENNEKFNKALDASPPKTPSLESFRKKPAHSRSVPAKRLRGVNGVATPTGVTETGRKGGETDPVPRGRQAAVVQNKQKVRQTRGKDASRLDFSEFRVNPDVNDGLDFAFKETVRNKEARRCLPGCVRACCRELSDFTSAAGLPKIKSRAPRWRSSSPVTRDGQVEEEPESEEITKEFLDRFGKHRDAFPRRRSPPGFWDADFPDTQTVQKQRREAEDRRAGKLEEMKREAEKGGRGRFRYKD